ncbi:DsrE family protein [Sulfuriflexus mobilis]|uniref:DsrE family protein n=1 Tax=Sulfuriflexus mobilis TaxID=1811807 RepID=UPI001559818D|nr:DsrE family protein [Sulfuriflexus mobilis]
MRWIFSIVLSVFACVPAYAADNAPWGSGNVNNIQYKPQRVVYDVAAGSLAQFRNVLDRVSYLSKVYNADPFAASIVIVLHGDEIPFFATKNYQKYKDLMQRAQSLSFDEVIKFRMCRIAAQGHGYEPKDIHGFVEMVPMADAEIVRLQQEEGHVYMR